MVSVVNVRGRVVWVRNWEVETMRTQGCKIIVNPREDYYPQYDQTLPQHTALNDVIIENVSPEDILGVIDV